MLLHQWPTRAAASRAYHGRTNTIEISESLRLAGSLLAEVIPPILLASVFPLAKTYGVPTHLCNRTQRRRPTLTNRDHSVVVLAPYGLTATTASSSVVGLCRDVTVTHSPGFTVLIAANPLSGTLMRMVRY